MSQQISAIIVFRAFRVLLRKWLARGTTAKQLETFLMIVQRLLQIEYWKFCDAFVTEDGLREVFSKGTLGIPVNIQSKDDVHAGFLKAAARPAATAEKIIYSYLSVFIGV